MQSYTHIELIAHSEKLIELQRAQVSPWFLLDHCIIRYVSDYRGRCLMRAYMCPQLLREQ